MVPGGLGEDGRRDLPPAPRQPRSCLACCRILEPMTLSRITQMTANKGRWPCKPSRSPDSSRQRSPVQSVTCTAIKTSAPATAGRIARSIIPSWLRSPVTEAARTTRDGDAMVAFAAATLFA